MGPTYIKFGQLLSTRVDLLPRAYTEALTRLQDDVEPFGFAEVEQIVTGELGVSLRHGFTSFDEQPLAAGPPRGAAQRPAGCREGPTPRGQGDGPR